MSISRHIFLLCSLLLLSACVKKIDVLGTNDPNWGKWQAQKQQLTAIDDFSMQGKVGVKTGSKGGSARIIWHYDKTPFNQYVELYGPFGGGRMIINADDNGALLQDAKGNQEQGANTEQLLFNRLGWRIPFAQLTSWVKGLPAAETDRVILDEQGLLAQTSNDSWTVTYEQYQQIDNLNLPRKLTILSRKGLMQFYDKDGEYLDDQISIKVILTHWQTK